MGSLNVRTVRQKSVWVLGGFPPSDPQLLASPFLASPAKASGTLV